MANWRAIGRRQQDSQSQQPQQPPQQDSQSQQPQQAPPELPNANPPTQDLRVSEGTEQIQSKIKKPFDKPGNFVGRKLQSTNPFDSLRNLSSNPISSQTFPQQTTSREFISTTQSYSTSSSLDSASPLVLSAQSQSDESGNDYSVQDLSENCKFRISLFVIFFRLSFK